MDYATQCPPPKGRSLCQKLVSLLLWKGWIGHTAEGNSQMWHSWKKGAEFKSGHFVCCLIWMELKMAPTKTSDLTIATPCSILLFFVLYFFSPVKYSQLLTDNARGLACRFFLELRKKEKTNEKWFEKTASYANNHHSPVRAINFETAPFVTWSTNCDQCLCDWKKIEDVTRVGLPPWNQTAPYSSSKEMFTDLPKNY